VAREFNSMAGRLEQARTLAVDRPMTGSLSSAGSGGRKMARSAARRRLLTVAAPLNVISGRAELMLQTSPEPEVRERHLRIIVRQIGRITGIVQNLLTSPSITNRGTRRSTSWRW
jgi:signal transduction histidine kinase